MHAPEPSVGAALRQIVKQHGAEIFENPRRTCAMLEDLAPGDTLRNDRRRVKQALQAGAVELLQKALQEPSASSLYFNESVARLIAQTDMKQDIARQTMRTIAEALSISSEAFASDAPADTPPVSRAASNQSQSSSSPKTASPAPHPAAPRTRIRRATVLRILAGTAGVLSVAALVCGLIFATSATRQWMVGLGGGVLLTAASIVLAFWLETVLYNEPCQTLTVILPIVLTANLLCRVFMGESAYGITFVIGCAWIVAGAIANAIFTRVELEKKWTLPNLLVALCGAFVCGLIGSSGIGRQWVIGLGGGLLLTVASIVLAFWLENQLGNEPCQTVTVILPIVLVAAILCRALLGQASCGILFVIGSAWVAAGAIATAIWTRIEAEDAWTWPNLIVALCGACLCFWWPGDWSWTVWQWIIGIGGGLLLAGILTLAVFVFEVFGADYHISLFVIDLLLTIANLLLLLKLGKAYLIIGLCLMVLLTIGALIGTFFAFGEESVLLGLLLLGLTILNGGMFLWIVLGSYDQFLARIQTLLDRVETASEGLSATSTGA